MKQLTLKEIQSEGVGVMKKIHDFCIANNLRYSLAYGTLIGAIRHKGFIPWDDDIDIVMPRSDYEFFISHYKDEQTAVFSVELKNSCINYARVCDMKNTVAESYPPWTTSVTGLWIDIFPIDGIDETKKSFEEKISLLKKYDSILFQTRGARMSRITNDIVKNIKIIGKRILYRQYEIDKVIEEYNRVLNLTSFDEASICGQVAYPVYIGKEYQDKADYLEYIDIMFEGCYFKCFKNYDKILRNYYNDYMKLPPMEHRTPKHSEHLVFWKI